ncbi:cuticle protein 21-like [Teleopsis dalmanni]|uniref:cuticle protein 21-like n=1 Tax=Teleopsis dalmanni TaxID=139649 RepID=UPI0018CFB42C|nr:cuticle protein 21-like [Teleopsis dalmanni]
MASKCIIVLAFIAVAHAAVVAPIAPVVRAVAPLAVAPAPVLAKTVELEEYDPHPQYKYGYDVQDTLSGDSKGHIEERDGDIVRGEYSLIDADGFRRIVQYTADPINGFNAVVRREPLVAAAPVVVNAAPVAPAKLTFAAPAVAVRFVAALLFVSAVSAGIVPEVYHSAPVAYAAAPTVVKTAHVQPIAIAHAQPVLAKHDDEFDPHPQYKFGYDVQDALSGDTKSQVEERDGDVVHGEYSLVDADGFKRVVQYTADSVNGFNAVVNRVPLEHAAIKTVVKSAPVAYAAPATTIVKEYPTPVAYHQHH